MSRDVASDIDQASQVARAFTAVRGEIVAEVSGALLAVAPAQVELTVQALAASERIFVLGAGRSGLALRMGAMRLMHLGCRVFVAGDATTPAIGAADALLCASGSGATPGIVAAATRARTLGARVIAITTDVHSALAAQASVMLQIEAAAKRDRSLSVSRQFAGSLFEQALVLTLDVLFHALWQRHANLE